MRLRSTVTHRELIKDHRRNQTLAERCLWEYLRGRRLLGLKFRRQHGIGPYIADFYCDQYKLIIEVDGDIHLEKDVRDNDRDREKILEKLGYIFVRVSNAEVLNEIDSVLQKIQAVLT